MILVSEAEIQAEAERLAHLGVSVHQGSPILKEPFAAERSRRSWLVPSQWHLDWVERAKRQDVDHIQRDELLLDLSILEQTVTEAYGGFSYFAAKGFNWGQFFAGWRAHLQSSTPEVTFLEGFQPWYQLKSTFVDNHSGPVLGPELKRLSDQSSSRTYRLPGGTLPAAEVSLKTTDGRVLALEASEPSHQIKQVLGPQLEEASYIVVPSGRGDVSSLICGQEEIPLKLLRGASIAEIESLHAGPFHLPSVREIDKDTVLIRIPTLVKENFAELDRLHEEWSQRPREHSKVVIDLRANGGGDGGSALDLLLLWVDREKTEVHFEHPKVVMESCLAEALRYGYTQATSLRLSPPLPNSLRNSIQGVYDGLFSTEACEIRKEVQYPSAYNYSLRPKSDPYQKVARRFLILTDQHTGSDGEWLTYILRSIPEALVLGQNTLGVAQFIQPGYFILPHTRIGFRIARGVADQYGDSRLFDGYGFDVDILLESHSASEVLKVISRIQ